MSATFDFPDSVVLVTGIGGALGSAVAEGFLDAGAVVCGADLVTPDDEDFLLDSPERVDFYHGDFTDESVVEETVEGIVASHGQLDFLANIAGTWRGGDSIDETAGSTFDFLFDVNLKTMFLASKHAIPHINEQSGAIVSVSAESSLEGGEGDGIYRATKAGVRLLTETIAAENDELRANAVMPSVIDTPMNREMMPDADHSEWVDPTDIADTFLALCSDATSVTSGAAVPVYGDA
ncbi:SDR family oxidoreductase [Halovenus rubra]|uniref:SDR family oxidoreductase n=2 Tax=Halovenus rubra TaxID=869890 RepID=A0ACC7DYV4_9EURY|nr:SDR family oxidoreductase [Halovenus rubra]